MVKFSCFKFKFNCLLKKTGGTYECQIQSILHVSTSVKQEVKHDIVSAVKDL